jgi:hypothetical protein
VLSVLLSRRVPSQLGTRACRELIDAGLGTPERMRDAFGPVGADIVTREVQAVGPEFRPHLDAKALAGAQALGLPQDPAELAQQVAGDDLARLAAALVRADREKAVREDVQA